MEQAIKPPVTSHKGFVEELEEAQRIAHIGSWYWDSQTDVTIGSEELLRIYGFDPATQTMPNFQDQRGPCYPAEDWEKINSAVINTLETGVGYELDVRAFRGNIPIWITTRGEVIKDANGKVVGLRGTVHDITERKQSELALENSEKQLRFVLEGSELGFWDWDIVAGKVDRNARWAEMLGYAHSEIQQTAKQWTDFIHPDDRDRAWNSINAVLEGRSNIHRMEYRMFHKDGGIRWILDQASVMQRDVHGKPSRMCGTHTDITERKLMEAALHQNLADIQRHNLQMVALNRMDDLLLACETRQEAHVIIAESAGVLFDGFAGGLAVNMENSPVLQIVAVWGEDHGLLPQFSLSDCWALQCGELYEVTDPAHGRLCQHFTTLPEYPYLCLPLIVRGEILGLLHVSSRGSLFRVT